MVRTTGIAAAQGMEQNGQFALAPCLRGPANQAALQAGAWGSQHHSGVARQIGPVCCSISIDRGADGPNLSASATLYARPQRPEWGAGLSLAGQEPPLRGQCGVGSFSHLVESERGTDSAGEMLGQWLQRGWLHRDWRWCLASP
ncbi:hypothetical protein KIL84_011277 [Mauremys mutica]|uniref:Uncharacterized protein n=1 Tax=Mauremys mutica TaxID=74926 RepID=A0A9D3XEI7_9SAUR|nr:hypothetical protein KIL84_011277 [Mauremys mutica]